MLRFCGLVLAVLVLISCMYGCRKKKEPVWVDMDSIKTDGSHDDSYLFKKEIEKERERSGKYKKDNF